MAAGQPQGDMATLLRQAMSSLQSPNFSPTPSGGGVIDPSVHPTLAKIISTIAQGAQSFGWPAMTDQERTERTQLSQQKAETMARLAQAGVGMEQTALWRGEQAETARQRAATAEENVQRQKERDKAMGEIAQSRVDVQREMVEVRKAIGEGRLDVAHQQLTQRASQFEQLFKLRAQQVGIEQAKLELMEQGNMIKQGFLAVAQGALSQRGTVEGAGLAQKLQTLQLEHPILSQIIGLDDVSGLVNESRGAGIPSVPGGGVPTTGATAPVPAAPRPQKTTPQKKAVQKPSATEFHYDSQGNRIASPNAQRP